MEGHIKGEHDEKKKSSLSDRLRDNPWILSTVVLSVFVVVLMVSGSAGVSSVSIDKAGDDLVDFLNIQAGGGVERVSSNDLGSIYRVDVSYNGQNIPVYVTKDGSYFVQGIVPLTGAAVSGNSEFSGNVQIQDIPKKDVPEVELFVMSHCPYGTQAEKGILPSFNLLNKSVNAGIRFVDYAMHPSQGEVEEQLNQYCIQKEQPEIYFDYLECFLEEGDSEGCMTELGIDKSKVDFCYDIADEEFNVSKNLGDESSWVNGRFPQFNVHKELNEKYGVEGSPTLIINGFEVDSGRSPQAFLDVICSSFTEGNIPEECETDLPDNSYKTGFGWVLSTGEATDGAKCY